MHIYMSDVGYSRNRWLVGEKKLQGMRSGYCEEIKER